MNIFKMLGVLACSFVWVVAAMFKPAHADYSLQTTYVDIPVNSYMAYPQDQNFIPASEFMLRTDRVDNDANIQIVRQNTANQTGMINTFGNRPAVICRSARCSRLNDRITRTYLFNTLSNLFMLNSHSKMSICEADPFTRSCLQSGISFPASVGIANALIKVPSATISQVSVSTGLSQAKLSLSYFVLVNGMETQCQATTAEIMVPNEETATLASPNFSCDLTHDGTSNVSLLLSIDYIDLDYGILGGYYSFGMQGPAQGGGTGYALMKLEYTNQGAAGEALGNSTSQQQEEEFITVEQRVNVNIVGNTISGEVEVVKDVEFVEVPVGEIPDGEVRVYPLEK